MSCSFVLAVSGATAGACFALLALSFAKAPGWGALRWFSLTAASAAGYCACIAAELATEDVGWILLFVRGSVALGALNAYAWLRYSSALSRRTVDRVLEGLVLGVGIAALVPGMLVSGAHAASADPHVVIPTAPGLLGLAVVFGVVGLPLARYVTRWRAGEAGAGAHALGLAGLMASGAVDVLLSIWSGQATHLVSLGLLWMVVAVGGSLARRVVRDACELEALSARLDVAVEQRTGELARAHDGLIQFEKLAALGRLSAAVAHEINNPAAAVSANLGYMRDVIKGEGHPPADAVEVIGDTLESIQRIARIVQQLGDAGELAIRGGATTAVCLADLARRAAADAHGSLGEGVVVSVEIAEEIHVRTQEGSLRQVLTGLMVSAAQAMRASEGFGRIRVTAERQGEQVAVRVEDPSSEPDEARRSRRFDPFVSARPTHVAQGVGLSVSVALLRVFGGHLQVERSGEQGTTMRIDVLGAEAPTQRSEAPPSSRSTRARVLLVDDDVLVRIGLRRLLGREYTLEEAGSVKEALAIVRARGGELDAILCDLVMPDGGAGEILAALEGTDPLLAAATVLMTGGAVDESTQSLLDAHSDRVLRKPVDLAAVRTMIERVRRRQRDVAAPRRA